MPAPPEALEALRRRCYAPDATDDDRERYRAALAAEQATAPPPAQAARPRTRSLRPVALLALLLTTAGAGTAAIAAPHPSRTPPTPPPFHAAPHGPHPGPAPRIVFLDRLARGDDAGIAAFLAENPTAALLHATRSTTVEVHGKGAATVALHRAAAWSGAGHATVLLVLGRTATGGWTAYRRSTSGGASDAEAHRSTRLLAGALTATTFDFGDGAQPVRLTVDVPDGTTWGAAVLLTR